MIKSIMNVNELRNYLWKTVTKNKNNKGIHISPRCLTYHSNNGLPYTVTKYSGINDHGIHLFRIRFFNTGYEYDVPFGRIIRGNVDDPTDASRSKYGVTLGEHVSILKNNDNELYNALKDRWWAMIHRCYEPKSISYSRYGGIGITVCKRWFCFENYYRDVTSMKSFNREQVLLNELQLDKDYLQQNMLDSEKVYSKETCIWLSPKSNHLNIDQSKIDRSKFDTSKAVEAHALIFIVTFPDGHEEIHKNLMKFCRENNIQDANAGKCLRGERNHTCGFKFRNLSDKEYNEYKDPNSGKVLKEKIIIDKKNLILPIDEYMKNTSLIKYIKLADCFGEHPDEVTNAINKWTKRFIVTFPDGHEEIGKNVIGFCRTYNLDSSSATKCMNGKRRQVKGYKFRRITNSEYEEYIKLIKEKGSTTILK